MQIKKIRGLIWKNALSTYVSRESLDGKRLHRMVLDDSRLFKRRSESIVINAAVHISLDISASMGSRMELAREAVLALVYVLKQANGVTVSASVYPGTHADRIYPIMSTGDSAQSVASVLTALNSHDTTPMATGYGMRYTRYCKPTQSDD